MLFVFAVEIRKSLKSKAAGWFVIMNSLKGFKKFEHCFEIPN